jgi:chromosomal replication initiation ATPase DnaA
MIRETLSKWILKKMNKDRKVSDIYLYVNDLLGIDIAESTKTTEYVEGRALFYALCIKQTNLSKKSMGNYVGKNHCAVIHAMDHTINVLSDHRVIEAYSDFLANKNLETRNEKIIKIMNSLTDDQYNVAIERIEAMVKMIK